MYEDDEKRLQFYRCEAAAVTRAKRIAERRPFQSVGTAENGIVKEVKLVCFSCAGEDQFQNPEHYLKPGTADEFTSEWNNKAKRSKWGPGPNQAARAISNLQSKSDRLKQETQYATPEELLVTMRSSKPFTQGLDWVNELVPHLHLLYGCVECDRTMFQQFQSHLHSDARIQQMDQLGVYPLKSSDWLRLAKPNRRLEPGMTTAGSGDCAWHCPGCCEKWTHAKQAPYRLLIAAPYLDTAQAGDEVFCAYIGPLLDPNAKGKDAAEQISLEKQINMLKGMTLLKEIGNRTVTKDLVLRAIEHLNENCQNALCKMGNVVNLFSPDHTLSEKHWDKQHYCEDERLSLGPQGTDVLALAVDRNKTQTLTKEDMQQVIDWCASFYDFDKADVRAKTKSERRTLRELRERVSRLNLASKL